MTVISLRLPEDTKQELDALISEGQTVSQTLRALIREAYVRHLYDQARAHALEIANDPAEQQEAAEIARILDSPGSDVW